MNTKPMNKLFICNGFRVLLALAFSLSLAGVLTVPARALVYVVFNLNDSGAGSLRQAILNANANTGADTITFSVSGTITLLSGLPVISESLTIDGTGQKIRVSGNDLYRVFEIDEHAGDVAINNLGIVRGFGSWGGGIDFWGWHLTVKNSTFSGNHADFGGAIYSSCMNPHITLTVINSTFSGNSAVDGGALYNCWDVEFEEYDAGVLIVKNSTFSGNSASGNGADIANKGGILDVSNSILANSAGGANCYSTKGNAGAYNLIENNSGCGTPLLTSDPSLGPLAYNGGSTQTFALQPISPAIGAGNDSICAAGPTFNLDQRGVVRPLGTHCDIGSYEAPVFRSVTTSDGWILESSESSGVGGGLNSTATTVRLRPQFKRHHPPSGG
jgi:predicted outer membrane repeat protein